MKKFLPYVIGIFVTIFTCILYINLGRDALFDWDEGIYAELGRELMTSKNIFVTTWNGEVWFEKPPGIAWLSAIGQTVGGTTPFGARLLQPFIASGVLVCVYLIGKKMSSWRTGVMAAAILAGFNLYLGRTRAVNADMPLLLGISGTIAAVLYNKKPAVVAAIIAASIWFKGVAGLLPVIIAAPLFLTKSKNYLLSSIFYSLIFILPWHVYAYLAYGERFLTPYIREQVVARVTSPIEFHMESRWFYLQYLYENLGVGVLLVATLGATMMIVQEVKNVWRKKLESNNYHLATILWWVLAPIAIFTLAKTRLFWYILPVYPAIALLAAYAIDRVSTTPRARMMVTIIALLMCLRSLSVVYASVEPAKKQADLSDRLHVVSKLHNDNEVLAVLVPPTERTAEAILPVTQRISSSFRYGGMPSVVYYYRGPVKFFYNVDEFNAFWQNKGVLGLVHHEDIPKLPEGYKIKVDTKEYVGIYADR